MEYVCSAPHDLHHVHGLVPGPEYSFVGGLSAALRVEGGSVEDREPGACSDYCGVELLDAAVVDV